MVMGDGGIVLVLGFGRVCAFFSWELNGVRRVVRRVQDQALESPSSWAVCSPISFTPAGQL